VDKSDWLAERFEENQTHLRAVAYRMLGSLSEADDAVARTVLWVRRCSSAPQWSRVGQAVELAAQRELL
jgi:RNA polymerase sigma-70 factor (ECF subfamily)